MPTESENALEQVCSMELTAADAERLRARLTKFYREPVQPVSVYCKALRTWQRALGDRAYNLKIELFPGLDGKSGAPEAEAAFAKYQVESKASYAENLKSSGDISRSSKLSDLVHYREESESVDHVALQISKSALLARLIYGGEKLRSRKCLIHEGRWSGLPFMDNQCMHGCDLTGWLPEPGDD